MPTNNAINVSGSGIVSYNGSGSFSALTNPLSVSNGGFGGTTYQQYRVLSAGSTSTAAAQIISGAVNSGDCIFSNGSGAFPTYKAAPTGAGMLLYRNTNTSFNPADSTGYRISNTWTSGGSALTIAKILVPKSGRLQAVCGALTLTAGSAENFSLIFRLTDSSSTTIATVQLNASEVVFSNYNMNVTVSAGNFIELITSATTWATNPTNINLTCSMLVI